jgi:hypothetical protein
VKKKPARKRRKIVKRTAKQTARIAKAIHWRVSLERGQGNCAAREAHLRSLMGLPAKPTWREIEREQRQ